MSKERTMQTQAKTAAIAVNTRRVVSEMLWLSACALAAGLVTALTAAALVATLATITG
jgi:hypothetical protein